MNVQKQTSAKHRLEQKATAALQRAIVGTLLGAGLVTSSLSAQSAPAAQTQTATQPGVPFTADKLTSLLPTSVYFAGRTAPLQVRNAGGVQFGAGATMWAALVDTSGYSSDVQSSYQFYLVTEAPIRVGSVDLRPGAYGGGFVNGRLVLLDMGNHRIGEGATQTDSALRRPRPLQVVADRPNAVRLYLGRQWVSVETAAR